VRVLFVSSIRIRNNGRVKGNDGVEISSYISNMFDACVETFESTIELSIADEVGDRMLIKDEEWKEETESETMVCESVTRICDKDFVGVEYSIFFSSKMLVHCYYLFFCCYYYYCYCCQKKNQGF
jgi:hypothetical protein